MEVIIIDEEALQASHVAIVECDIVATKYLIRRSLGKIADGFRNQIEKLQEDADGSKFIEALRTKLTALGKFMDAEKVMYRNFGRKEVYLFTKEGGKVLSMTIGEGNINDGWLSIEAAP